MDTMKMVAIEIRLPVSMDCEPHDVKALADEFGGCAGVLVAEFVQAVGSGVFVHYCDLRHGGENWSYRLSPYAGEPCRELGYSRTDLGEGGDAESESYASEVLDA